MLRLQLPEQIVERGVGQPPVAAEALPGAYARLSFHSMAMTRSSRLVAG